MERKTPLGFSRFVFCSESTWFWVTSVCVLLTYFFIFLEANFPVFSYVWYVFGPLYFFYLPGALIVETVYGRKEDKIKKLATSIGLSFAVTILNGLMLNYTYLGITPSMVTISLMTLTEVLAVIMLLKRYLYYRVYELGSSKPTPLGFNTEPIVKRSTVSLLLKLGVFFSYLFPLLFIFTSPRFDYAQPDPYFHLNSLPLTYWIGLVISTVAILVSTLKNQSKMGLWALFPFIALTNSIPRLMYKNKIWYDTYPFVGETFYIIKYGRIEFASVWSTWLETPGISVFTAQLSMVSGIDYLILASFLPLFMPIIVGALVYLIAKFFLSDRGAVLASFFYFSSNWIGFYFNRECFSLILQLLTWYFTLQTFSEKTWKRFSMVLAILSFLALAASHPGTSLFIVFNTFSLVVLTVLIRLLRKREFAAFRRLALTSMNFAVIFFLIWLSWYSPRTLPIYLGEMWESMESLVASPDPVSRATSLVTPYSHIYYQIVMLRFYEVVFSFAAGFFLSLFFLLYRRRGVTTFLLSTWYLSTILFSAYQIYSVRESLFHRSFLYSLPSFSILLAFFLTESDLVYLITRRLTKAAKMFLVLNIILFSVSLPITMYAHIPFVYPPTATLNSENFLTSRGRTFMYLIGAHVETDYFYLLHGEKVLIFRPLSGLYFLLVFNFSEITSKNIIIGWVHRGYAKEAFVMISEVKPSVIQSIATLEKMLETDPKLGFARAYVANPFHVAYVRQK